MNLLMTCGAHPERWATAERTQNILATGRLALPYCLKQLRGWLSRGGMALGAPAP